MTEFACPRHGTYQRSEGVPEGVPITCGHCRTTANAEREEARLAFDRQMRVWRRWEASEVPARYQACTVGNWLPQPGQETAARMLQVWADDVRLHWNSGEGLLLMGAPGVGKTHLLAGLTAACIAAGYSARYASWPDVWDRCRPPFEGQHPEALLRDLARIDFLALDEIGVRTGTDKEQARLFELVDARYRDKLPTIVATNATQATLPMIGERTADRLLEACIPIAISGDSNRRRALRAGNARPAIAEPEPRRVTRVLSINGNDVEQSHEINWQNSV
ncbi:ATP-binding protein [Lysobacter sp. FW306-1B-D06B]|uniref:ATP-binding protein n=1 Tax=Lysobacter sp. FW306-1B-D06B TaxID=3140250 RepID=UPI003140C86F